MLIPMLKRHDPLAMLRDDLEHDSRSRRQVGELDTNQEMPVKKVWAIVLWMEKLEKRCKCKLRKIDL